MNIVYTIYIHIYSIYTITYIYSYKVIDIIDFDHNLSTKEKEGLCEEREGYWQHHLKTFKKFGVMNVLDSNRRFHSSTIWVILLVALSLLIHIFIQSLFSLIFLISYWLFLKVKIIFY